jgi:hypothetical protein
MAINPNPSVIIGGGGTASVPTFTITGAGSGYTWNNATSTTTAKGQLKLEGNDADIFVQGKSMKAWMESVEQRLAILEPKPELLAKYESLRQAYEHYKTLEAILYDSADQE